MSEPTNSLAQYLMELGTKWMDLRKKELEPIWNRNFDMIKGLDPFPAFKKDDGGKTKGKEWRSDVVVNITRVKVFTLFGMLMDILLPDSKIPFTLEIGPDDMDDLEEDEKEFEENARDQMQGAIQQQLTQRKADRQTKKKLLSLLYYGLCWSKYNVKKIKNKGFKKSSTAQNVFYMDPAQQRKTERYEKQVMESDVPGHDFRSVWSIYWDMEVDFDRLEEGQGVFERDMISLYDLHLKKKMKGSDGQNLYIPKAIDKVIGEWEKETNPTGTSSLKPGEREFSHRKRNIDNREYWVRVPRKLIDEFEENELEWVKKGEEATVALDYLEDETGDDVHILVETANDEVIRYEVREDNWLAHKLGVWEENLDEPNNPGRSVPCNMVDVQKLITGFWRGYVDNKKLSGDVILAVHGDYLQNPAQIDKGIEPGTKISLDNNCPKASDAIEQVVIEDVGNSYIGGIGLVDRLKDTLSMVPEIMQGLMLPGHKVGTAYEASQLIDNSLKYVGSGVRNFDNVIEAEIWDIYEYNMMDPNFDPEAKGNYQCVPGGFINYKNRVLTIQQLERLIALLLSHEALSGEAKFKPYLEEIHRNMGFNPDNFLKSEDEKRKDAEQQMLMQEKVRLQALQDLAAQTQIETQSKIAIEDAKTKGKLAIEGVKADAESVKDEDNFQRDMVKEISVGAKR